MIILMPIDVFEYPLNHCHNVDHHIWDDLCVIIELLSDDDVLYEDLFQLN
jgi:hypothetical protein